ncbi:MAG: trypsin-like peptidase domain-containing protein [Ktedonobacterales bacterium]
MGETTEQTQQPEQQPQQTQQAPQASQTQQTALGAFSDQLAQAVEQAAKSIVTVAARPRQTATGILWSANGETIVLTADHVVEMEDNITVTLPDGRSTKAQLAGRDPSTDLAVLRLPDIELGATNIPAQISHDARVGHLALAVGRPTDGGVRVSFGVISSIGGPQRSWQGGEIERILYPDVTLYPGFSGGPLVNLEGKVIGLNSSHLTRQSAALPVVTLQRVVTTLLTHGRVRRGYLGVGTQQVPLAPALAQKAGLSQEAALLIVTVEPESPAEKAGMFVGDQIVGMGDQAVSNVETLRAALISTPLGQPLTIKILRGGEAHEVSVTVGERA